RLLEQPRRFGIRAATGEDAAERELISGLLGGRGEIHGTLEQSTGIAVAAGRFEQARRIELLVRAGVEAVRLGATAEPPGERAGLGVAAHSDQHVERSLRIAGDQLLRQLRDRRLVA